MASRNFPRFGDGDVEIHFSNTDQKFVLHSYVLALHSSWFKASLSERWNGARDAPADSKHRWVYEVRFERGTDIGMLTRRTATPASDDTDFMESGESDPPNSTQTAVVELHRKRVAWLEAHREMLGTLYHVQPVFDHVLFGHAKKSMLLLAEVAKVYDCEEIVKLHIERNLLSYRSRILVLCTSNPVAMLEFAIALKSDWIFKEAATNLLGRDEGLFDGAQPKLIELEIADLFNKKRVDFVATLKAVESAMFRVQPSQIHGWSNIAISFFRQWLAEELGRNLGSGLAPGYACVYHKIAKKQLAFKMAGDYQRFIGFVQTIWGIFGFPVGMNESQLLMPHLDAVVISAADVLAPILANVTRRQDKTEDERRSLLFMSIGDDELPWVAK